MVEELQELEIERWTFGALGARERQVEGLFVKVTEKWDLSISQRVGRVSVQPNIKAVVH